MSPNCRRGKVRRGEREPEREVRERTAGALGWTAERSCCLAIAGSYRAGDSWPGLCWTGGR